MRTNAMGTTGLAMVAAALMSLPSGAQEVHRISGGEVAIYNLAGRTRVVRGSGSDVVVRVTLGGSDARQLRVETGEMGGRATLAVVYPEDQIVYPEMGRGSRTTVRVRDDGTFWGDGSRGESVEIRGSGRGLEAWADLVVEVPAGKDFTANVAVGAIDARDLEGDIRLATGSGSVDVSGVSGSLEVDTGSGSATVDNVRGRLSVETGSGGVRVAEVEGDEVDLDTGSGGVTARGLRARALRVDTGSGSIDLDGVSSDEVELDTGSGSVELVLLTDVELLDVDTGSGSVTIRAPEDLGAQVEIDTGSGGIDMDFALEVRSVRRDHVVGRLGDGRGVIRIDTGSGSVRLLKN